MMHSKSALWTVAILCIATTTFSAEFVTVSLRPVANANNKRILNMPTGRQTLGSVPFDLLPTSGNNSWDAAVGTAVGTASTQTMVLPVNIHGATAVDALISTSWGAPEATYVSLSFVCSDSTTHTVTLKEGVDIRDWYEGQYVNKINGTTSVTVFNGPQQKVYTDMNRGRIDKQHIALPSEFAERTLSYVILSDEGVTGNDDIQYSKRVGAQRVFISGLTITTGGKPEIAASEPKEVPRTPAGPSLPEGPSLDALSQKMLDDTIARLKGKQAKEMSDLLQKYARDSAALAQQRRDLEEEMARETLKVAMLPIAPKAETVKEDEGTLAAVDAALAKARQSPPRSQSAITCRKEVLAAIDKQNAWNANTQAQQYQMFVAASADARQQLLGVYRKFEPKFAEHTRAIAKLEEQKKKDIFTVLEQGQ